MFRWFRICFILLFFHFFMSQTISAQTEQTRQQRKIEREKKRAERRIGKDKKKKEIPKKEKEEKKQNKKFQPPPIFRNSDNRRPEGKLPCLEKTFRMNTDIDTEPEVKVTCLIPLDRDGKPTQGANDMVFYSPFAGSRNAIEKRTELRRYANALGMTIFTLEITTDCKYLGDEQKYYCYAVSGWHEAALKARQLILDEFKFEKRKLFIVGDSVGGSYAQQIAARYPNEVDAVAFTGGRLFGEVHPNNISWLILSTWECPGMENSRNLAKEYEAMGLNVLQNETPPILPDGPAQHLFHHTPSKIAFEIMEDYIVGIRELRTQNNGTIPTAKDWPVHETILGKKYTFPSTATAESWKKLPNPLRAETAKKEYLPIIQAPENPDKKSRVIIYAHDNEIRNTILEDNICFIAQQGDYAIGLKSGASIQDYRFLCGYIKQMFPNKDIYAVGTYSSGENLAVAILTTGLKVKKLTLLNTDAEDLVESFDEYKSKFRGKAKILILCDENINPSDKNRYGIEEITFNTQEEFGHAWFNAIQRGMYDEP